MAYTPHTWQANELVTPEKLNAIEIGLGNTISNTGGTINGTLYANGFHTKATTTNPYTSLYFDDVNDTNIGYIQSKTDDRVIQIVVRASDYTEGSSKYRRYVFNAPAAGLTSVEKYEVLAKANVVNNLTSTVSDVPLSAAMGKQLNDSKLNLSGGTLTGNLNIGTTTDEIQRSVNIRSIAGRIVIGSDATSTGNRFIYCANADNSKFGTVLSFNQNNEINVLARLSVPLQFNNGLDYSILNTARSFDAVLIRDKDGGLRTRIYNSISQSNENWTWIMAREPDQNDGYNQIGIGLTASKEQRYSVTKKEAFRFAIGANNVTEGIWPVSIGGTGVATVSPNRVFAGPSTGTAADAPSFRQIVSNDIASLDAGKITSGTLIVGRGGTGRSSFTANKLLCGNGTGAIAELDGVGTSGQFLKSNGDAKPSWVTLSASSIATGTLAVSRGGTGVSTTSANYVFAGPSDKAGAPSFRKLQAVDIPSLTKSKISDINFGDATLQYSSSNTAGNTTSVPNGRGIIIISRAVSDEDDKIGIYHVAKGVTTIHYDGGLAEGKSPGITVTKASKDSNFSITVNSLSNYQYRITWFLYT